MLGGRLLEAPMLDVLVDPGIPVPAEATRIHGLGARGLAGAPRFGEVAADLIAALEGRVVIGHHVGFDLAILRHEAARAGVKWRDPRFLDVGLLAAALEPSLPDQGLETIARFLGVPVEGRHSAMGDALIAARAFAQLLARLRAANVHTLGEALAFAARRHDLLQRQAAAGWAVPESSAPEPAQPARIDTHIFERRLAEVMSAPPIAIAPDATLRDAAKTMLERRIGALLVGAAGAPPLGIVTERDLLRAGADAGIDPGAVRVSALMSSPVQCLRSDAMLYRALGRMDRAGIRHLCVVDASGNAVGMVSQRDLLQHRARSALALGDGVAEAHDAASLALAHARVTEVAARLVEEGLDGLAVAYVASDELRALTARAAELVSARLAAEGAPAPAPWCVLVLGSAGRGESLLGADQDNALVYAGGDADDAWFARLGEGMADLLDEAGVPRCRGGVMAANAQWRGTPERWRGRIGEWLQRASPKDLLNVDIFFDLVPVAGDAGLGQALHAEAVAEASRHPAFLALLAQSAAAMRPSIGPFGRLRARNGRIDLKLGGLLPLVGLARTLALRIGCAARGTPERLRAARAAGRLAGADADTLTGIHARLLTLVLRQQLADRAGGVALSGRVAAASLERDEARQLREDLSRLDDIVQEAERAVSG
jgi:DNA polymerase-3 subunit epsilon/CBS domain-containing protein